MIFKYSFLIFLSITIFLCDVVAQNRQVIDIPRVVEFRRNEAYSRLIPKVLPFHYSKTELFRYSSINEIDSNKYQSQENGNQVGDDEDSEGFSPGLLFFALFGVVMILLLVGAGITVTLIALIVLFGFISIGILSVAVVVGLMKKSFNKGFITFLMLIPVTGGLISGVTVLLLLNEFLLEWQMMNAVINGIFIGLSAGIIFGALLVFIFQRASVFLQEKFS